MGKQTDDVRERATGGAGTDTNMRGTVDDVRNSDSPGSGDSAVPTGAFSGGKSAEPAPGIEPRGEPVRRRGRPPGSGNSRQPAEGRAAASKKLVLNTSEVAKQIVGGHHIVAYFLQAPALVISPNEGMTLAEPVVAICEHYGLKQVGAWMLWVNLLSACAMVYGPRLFPAHSPEEPQPPNLWPPMEAMQ